MLDARARLAALALLVSALSYLLLYPASLLLPLFDKSPLLTPLPFYLSPILRWDAFHFFHISRHGYQYEHEWAFFSGAPIYIRYLPSPFLFLALAVVTCHSTLTLYRLSLHHLKSQSLARIVVILSLLSSSPVTVRLVPYSEPFFTYLSYKGMFYCATRKWGLAAAMFTLASSFRSNGSLLSGYILWGMVVHPLFVTQKVAFKAVGAAFLLSSLIFVPFIHQNYKAYTIFCDSPASNVSSWCARSLPSVYTYTQDKYWNVGFLRYWSPSQIPNFIVAAPLFLLITNYAISYTRYHLFNPVSSDPMLEPFYDISILPHVIHSVVLFLILLTSAHTQIALRLAPSIPFTYWSAARLLVASPRLGRWWVSWSIMWGIASIILWASFLPPA